MSFTPKVHINKSIIDGIKYLDANQDRLCPSSGHVADNVLDIVDRYMHLFVLDDDDDHHHHTLPKETASTNNNHKIKAQCVDNCMKSSTKLGKPISTTSKSTTITTKSPNLENQSPEEEFNHPAKPPHDPETSSTITITPPITTVPNQTLLPNVIDIGLGGIKQGVEDSEAAKTCQGFISYIQLQKLSKLLTELHYPSPHLHQLLQSSTVCHHTERVTNYTPEFAAHLAFLRQRQAKESLEYAMIEAQSIATGIKPHNHTIGSRKDQNDHGIMSKGLEQIGAPIHFVAVAGTCSFVFYIIGKTLFMHEKMVHWAFAIVGLLFGFILETSMFVLRDYHDSQGEKAKRKSEKLREEQIKRQIMHSLFPKGRTTIKTAQSKHPLTIVDNSKDLETKKSR